MFSLLRLRLPPSKAHHVEKQEQRSFGGKPHGVAFLGVILVFLSVVFFLARFVQEWIVTTTTTAISTVATVTEEEQWHDDSWKCTSARLLLSLPFAKSETFFFRRRHHRPRPRVNGVVKDVRAKQGRVEGFQIPLKWLQLTNCIWGPTWAAVMAPENVAVIWMDGLVVVEWSWLWVGFSCFSERGAFCRHDDEAFEIWLVMFSGL